MSTSRDCILEVDDDANDIFFLRHAFKEAGITNPVRVVSDGEQAIAYLTGRGPYADRTAYPLPSLVLLDLKLPRQSGLEVLQWLHEQPRMRQLVVVVFSASRDPADIERSYALGANAFVVKPVDLHACVEFAKSLKAWWLECTQFAPITEPNPVPPTAAAEGPSGLSQCGASRWPTPMALALGTQASAQSRSPWELT